MAVNNWSRFGALLRSYSTDPTTARGGQEALAMMDDEENTAKLTQQKAEEAKRGVFQKLLEKGIDNGADEDTLQKLAGAAGIDSTGMGLSGLGKPKMDPIQKRTEAAQKFGEKYDPASVDQWIQTGQWSSLKPIQKAEKGTVLRPQDQLVVGGEVIAENKNVRPTRSSGPLKPKPANYVDTTGKTVLVDESNPEQVRQAIEGGWTKTGTGTASGYKDKVRTEVVTKGEKLRAEIGNSPKLSDRLRMASQKLDEKAASGTTGVAFVDKQRQQLSSRRESLVRYDNAADRVMAILDKDPTAATVGADAAKSFASMAANAKGLLNLIPGADLTDVDLDPSDWSDQLTKIAGDNNELRTTMFNLAIQKAVADGLAGGKFTNQQISQALDNIGASGRSPRAIRRKLQEVRKDIAGALDVALDGALEDYSALDRPDPTQVRPTKEDAMAEARRRGLVK